jgi:hypothetical protein
VAIADFCIEKASEDPDGFYMIGGFEVSIVDGAIGLQFVVERSNVLKAILSSKHEVSGKS